MTRRTSSILAFFVAAFAALPHAQAQQGRPVPPAGPTFVMSARNVTAAEAASRGTARRDSAALPGDEVRYSMVFTNTTDGAIRNVTLDNPLPAGLQYVAGSARATRAEAPAEFSVDGGRTYSAQPMETVVVNGVRTSRPVPTERYTHVRWVIRGAVAPRATVTAEFSARVPDGRVAGTPGNRAPSRR